MGFGFNFCSLEAGTVEAEVAGGVRILAAEIVKLAGLLEEDETSGMEIEIGLGIPAGREMLEATPWIVGKEVGWEMEIGVVN